ncbi:unnamed protein product [Pylaiella littoralis]
MIAWVDKHRPVDFDGVVGNDGAVRIVANLARQRSTPNLLICGPPGCGKTMCADLLCGQIITPRDHDSRVLRLSSFDERGVGVVRTAIKSFAVSRVATENDSRIAKLVVLDEADSMSSGAFQALRNVMDAFSDTTRFLIVCNDSTKIIEPIQSRCAILRFAKVEESRVCQRISRICDSEKVPYTAEGVKALARAADGDVRSAINSLHSTVSAFGRVTAENVYRTCGHCPQPVEIARIVVLLRDKNSKERSSFAQAARALKVVCDKGYSPPDIVQVFFRVCCVDDGSLADVGDAERIALAKVIGLAQARVLAGVSSYLQLAAMCDGIAKVFGV